MCNCLSCSSYPCSVVIPSVTLIFLYFVGLLLWACIKQKNEFNECTGELVIIVHMYSTVMIENLLVFEILFSFSRCVIHVQ